MRQVHRATLTAPCPLPGRFRHGDQRRVRTTLLGYHAGCNFFKRILPSPPQTSPETPSPSRIEESGTPQPFVHPTPILYYRHISDVADYGRERSGGCVIVTAHPPFSGSSHTVTAARPHGCHGDVATAYRRSRLTRRTCTTPPARSGAMLTPCGDITTLARQFIRSPRTKATLATRKRNHYVACTYTAISRAQAQVGPMAASFVHANPAPHGRSHRRLTREGDGAHGGNR